MKYFFVMVLVCTASLGKAQKYVLFDEAIAQPAIYSNHLNEMEKYNKFFPVETKDIPQFLSVLQEIAKQLSEHKVTGSVKDYKVGCAQFTGKVFPLAVGNRIDYVLTSNCDGIKVTMHLCDAKLSNANNAYFVKTWIKYIRSTLKQHE